MCITLWDGWVINLQNYVRVKTPCTAYLSKVSTYVFISYNLKFSIKKRILQNHKFASTLNTLIITHHHDKTFFSMLSASENYKNNISVH